MGSALNVRTVVALSSTWLLLVGVGMGLLWRHTLTPGAAAQTPGNWPSGVTPGPAAGRYTLMMWCHPQCPCTPASVEALSRLSVRAGDRLDVRVYFLRPKGVTDLWVRSKSWRLAKAIPGARVLEDDGELARRFGVRTSGQTLMFADNSRLRFSGGLTAGRGHEGESQGLESALRLVRINEPARWDGPVYGCSLFGVSAVDRHDIPSPVQRMAIRSQEIR